MTLKKQFEVLKKEAHKRGLKIRKDKRLTPTKYRANHPLVSEIVGFEVKGSIGYDPKHCKTLKRKVMDVRHEIVEMDTMKPLIKKGYSVKRAYKIGHKVANKKQRDPNVFDG
jgi:hypothetical protein